MNVLILTPDAVGSTLLQRLITIYMQFHEFDRPVINLHELTNGLEKYWSPEFNREIVSKKNLQQWGYFQTLSEVTELLSSVDHYKVSRLAHYHLVRRGDSLADQIPFYQYLNDNFYIIACRRASVFEHAMSMTMNSVTKKLNVYTAFEKVQGFADIYSTGIELDPTTLQHHLDAYRDYLAWSKQHFDVARYFHYEQDMPNMERFILDLPVFGGFADKKTWQTTFGITFDDYNRFQYLTSDIATLALENPQKLQQLGYKDSELLQYYRENSQHHWPEISTADQLADLPKPVRDQFNGMLSQDYRRAIVQTMDPAKQSWLKNRSVGMRDSVQALIKMRELGIILTPPPIKKQTIWEKKLSVKNWDKCMQTYNQWCDQNPDIAQPLTEENVQARMEQERAYWKEFMDPADQPLALPPSPQ